MAFLYHPMYVNYYKQVKYFIKIPIYTNVN